MEWSRSTDREPGAATAARSISLSMTALALSLAIAGCHDGERASAGGGGAGPSRATAPRVAAEGDAGPGLVFTWFEAGGGFHVTSDRASIPEDRRAVVRVQDPSSPPLDPSRVWVVDLREPRGDEYTVRQMSRVEFERLGQPPPPPPQPPARASAAEADAGAAGERPQVVMYMSSTCPVCRSARTWLNRHHVSYVERNVGTDPAAATELEQKARRAGLRADGVPVFDVGGRLIPGFDEGALSQALGL